MLQMDWYKYNCNLYVCAFFLSSIRRYYFTEGLSLYAMQFYSIVYFYLFFILVSYNITLFKLCFILENLHYNSHYINVILKRYNT